MTHPQKIKYEENIFELINDEYMCHIKDDQYLLLCMNDYHCDHMEYSLLTDADSIMQGANKNNKKKTCNEIITVSEDNLEEYCNYIIVTINKSLYDKGIEIVAYTIDDDCTGYIHGPEVSVVICMNKYMKHTNNALYEQIKEVMKDQNYNKIVWKNSVEAFDSD